MPTHPVLLFVAAILSGAALLHAVARRDERSDLAEILLGVLLCCGLLLLGAGLKAYR